MIRGLIYQLSYSCYEASPPLAALFRSCENGRTEPMLASLLQTFLAMVEKTEELWLVLDALDECEKEERMELLSWIKDIRIGSKHKNVHILVISRPENDIKSGIEKLNCIDHSSLEIQNTSIAGDICAYVRWRIREGEGLQRWRLCPDIQDEIETKILQKSDGMFRWVACQLDAFDNCLDLRQLRQALNSLPKTLNETYARTLRKIPEEYKRNAITILQFLTYSQRSLSIQEMIDAIAVDIEDDPRFHPKYRMPNMDEIFYYCPSLITTTNDPDTNYTRLHLAHASVKEYLTSNKLPEDIAPDLSSIQANTSIAKTCLAYLLHLGVNLASERSDSMTWRKEIQEGFPFAEYCARYWIPSARVANPGDKALEDLLKNLFCNSKNSYLNSYNIYRSEGRIRTTVPVTVSRLYYASLIGLESIVDYLIENGADANTQDPPGYFLNALQAASSLGYYTIVEKLLVNGASVNIQGGPYGNALQAASCCGHAEIVKLLLSYNADVNAPNPQYGNALRAASSHGHSKVVEQLLANGADVNAQTKWGNALETASTNGYTKIVELLVSNGADIDQSGALYAAAGSGHIEVVELLLAKGADVNAPCGPWGTALQAASQTGHYKIVELLLISGADVNAQSRNIRVAKNALEVAASRGHGNIVTLLLEHGADISDDQYFSNLLKIASLRGHDEIVGILSAKKKP